MTPEAEPGQVRRNPVPSLLRSLLTDHLDPGYADEARLQASGKRRRPSRAVAIGWLVVGTLGVGLVFGVSGAQESRRAPDTMLIQQQIADDVRAQQSANAVLATERDTLAANEARERTGNLANDAEGARLLQDIAQAEVAAAAVERSGAGLRITIAEPPPRPDLSDKGRPSGAERGQAILDRDLQAVVNSLWVSGAEAVAVGGIRIGPAVSIRQAGGSILVDNQPVPSPYVVEAIGSPAVLQGAYIVSPAYLRLQILQQRYGVSVVLGTAANLTLPAAPIRELRYAQAD